MQFINFSNAGYASTTMLSYSPTLLANTELTLSDSGISFLPRVEGNMGNVISFSMWIKPLGAIGELMKWMRPTVSNAHLVRVTANSGFSVVNGASSSSTGTDSSTINSRLFPSNDWYHVAVCLRTGASSTGKGSMYINGVLFASELTHSNAFDVMTHLNKANFFERYSGKIGSLELWGTYLSQADAIALYNAGRTESPQSILPNGRLFYSFPMLSSNVTLNNETTAISNGNFEQGSTGWTFVNTADFVTFGNIASGNPVIAVNSVTGISVGMRLTASGIPVDTFVQNISAPNVVLSKAPTSTLGATPMIFSANKWVVGTADKFKGTNGLYVSSDNGTTSSYLNVATRIYTYRDVAVPANTPVLKIRAKFPSDSSDFIRVIIANTSFVPVAGTQYDATLTGPAPVYPSNILRFGQRLQSTTAENMAVAIGPRIYKEALMDLSAFAGQTVRLVFAFVCDTSLSNAWGAAIDEVSFVGKSKITGTRYNYVQFCANPSTYNLRNGAGNIWRVGGLDKYEGDNAIYITPSISNTVTYNSSALTVCHFYFDQALDLSKPIFTFKAKIGGENLYDGVSVRIVDHTSMNAPVPVAGSDYTGGLVTTIGSLSNACLTGGIFRDYYIDISPFINALAPNSVINARIVFTWKNDIGSGDTSTSAVIDNIGFIGNTPVESMTAEADFISNSISFDDDIP
jgi:hypothetical protein